MKKMVFLGRFVLQGFAIGIEYFLTVAVVILFLLWLVGMVEITASSLLAAVLAVLFAGVMMLICVYYIAGIVIRVFGYEHGE